MYIWMYMITRVSERTMQTFIMHSIYSVLCGLR
jgi:hypothetical protein